MAQSKIEMSPRRGRFLSTLEFLHNGGKIDAAIDDWEGWGDPSKYYSVGDTGPHEVGRLL